MNVSEKPPESQSVLNPFEHRIYLNWSQKLQLIFMSLTIFPVRVLGLLLSLFLLCSVCAIGTMGLPLVPQGPLEGWRRKLKPIVRALIRFAFFCFGYHKICVKGRENLNPDHDPDIVIGAPHSTFFDPIAIFAFKDLPTGVSRIENIQLPFVGYITKFFTPICVSRSDVSSRRETINQIKTRVQSRIKFRRGEVETTHDEEDEDDDGDVGGQCQPKNWPSICLFPEGTTGNGKSLITYKIGAFIPGQSVQPISIQHVNSMNTTSWTWVGEGVWKIMWMTMCQWSTTVLLTILPSYDPSPEEIRDPYLYASNVQGFMSEKIGIPTADFNFFDGPFVVYLSKLTLQPLPPLVKLNRILMALTKRSSINLSELVENIAESDLDHITESLLSLERFDEMINNHRPLKELMTHEIDSRELFDAVVKTGDKHVDVKKFLIFFCMCCQPERTWAIVEVAFKAYRSAGEESLTCLQFNELLITLLQCNSLEASIMERHISNQSSEISLKHLETLALIASDTNRTACLCSDLLGKFRMSKESLMKVECVGRRLPRDCKECLGASKKCGRDGSCDRFEEVSMKCRRSYITANGVKTGGCL